MNKKFLNFGCKCGVSLHQTFLRLIENFDYITFQNWFVYCRNMVDSSKASY